MESLIIMRYLCVLVFIIANINVAFAADEESYFYKTSSLSSIPADIQNNNLWLQNTGVNWKILPNLNVNFGYVDTQFSDTPNEESSSTYYQGLFGAALVQRSFDKLGTVYAKGGVNWIQESTENTILLTSSTDALYNINPYLSVGANIPTPLKRNLELNVELSYQNLQLEEPNTIFTMGAKYRF